MTQQATSGVRSTSRRAASPRVPELPRTYVDTRMPPAPAPGGRIIPVAAPGGRLRKAALDQGMVFGALAIVIGITIAWRVLRTHTVRQPLL